MKYSRFVVLALLLIAAGLLAGGLIASANSTHTPAQNFQSHPINKLAPWVQQKTADGEEAEFLVVMAEQADLSGADQFETKEEKGRYVFETLRQKAESTQAALRSSLTERRIAYQSFYIVNAVLVKGTRELALEIASRSDVARLEGNPQLRAIRPIEPAEEEKLHPQLQPDQDNTAELGVRYIRATDVWALGFTGQGIVIGGQDTGIQWDHPTLRNRYRGWDGTNVNHDYNWHDSIHSNGGVCGPDTKAPCDDDNHGTHTIGSAVGSDGGLNLIGVAPGAKFIGCRNMDRGDGTPARYIECLEFMLAPYPANGTPAQGDPTKAPHITTNSWTCPLSEGCEPNTLKAAIDAQRAAGIMTVAAAGNQGGRGCSSVVDPPGIYDSSYTIGAISAANGLIASFSGRGPVVSDGSNRIKPDITAPGVSVRSALRNNGYGVFSGTSMATPHVAGAIALLWSAYPKLRGQIELTENILNESAVRVTATDCGTSDVPNSVYGFGRLDIKAAFDLAETMLSPTEQIMSARGGTGKVEVTALPNVNWRAVSSASWIKITAGATGTGIGQVTFAVESNTSTSARRNTLMIAGRLVTITQPANAPPFAVSGDVTTTSSEPVGRVTMTFSRISGGGDIPASVITDEFGRWNQTGFEPGTVYRATPSKSRQSFTPESREFDAANTSVNFLSVGRQVGIGR